MNCVTLCQVREDHISYWNNCRNTEDDALYSSWYNRHLSVEYKHGLSEDDYPRGFLGSKLQVTRICLDALHQRQVVLTALYCLFDEALHILFTSGDISHLFIPSFLLVTISDLAAGAEELTLFLCCSVWTDVVTRLWLN